MTTLAPALPRFAVMTSHSVYDGRDAIVGTRYFIRGTAYTLGWARHLEAGVVKDLGEDYFDDGEGGLAVHEWRGDRWVQLHPEWNGEGYEAPIGGDPLADDLPF